jgi:hypothetical protein
MEPQLHSRYNPQAEAERYIDALSLGGETRYFILIEPGWGYLIQALRKRYPPSKIIALHVDSRFRAGTPGAETADVPAWYPDSGETAQRFLEREIPDAAAASVRVIEWRPSLRLYGESCFRLAAETAEFIKRADASYRTAAAFGERWVRNFFRNLALIRKALRFKPLLSPLIITGSGPGLENALPLISEMKDRVFILAASSSVLALGERGIVPDMVIAADGGSWALSHLYACFRGSSTRAHNLAVSLSAALPSQCMAFPFLTLSDGSLWQSVVLSALNIPSVVIPHTGTVTALALELALILSSGDIYLAGLDLSARDIRTHVRPYGFDHLFYGTASRLGPAYSRYFIRSADMRRGGSLNIYAAWFKDRLASWPGRIFSLSGNHEMFGENKTPRNWRGLPCPVPACFKETAVGGEPAANRRRGADALIRAMSDPRYAKTINEELAPLLFPGKKEVSIRELAEAIDDMAARRKGERHG